MIRRGRPIKYANEDERLSAKREDKKRWYKKNSKDHVRQYNKEYHSNKVIGNNDIKGQLIELKSLIEHMNSKKENNNNNNNNNKEMKSKLSGHINAPIDGRESVNMFIDHSSPMVDCEKKYKTVTDKPSDNSIIDKILSESHALKSKISSHNNNVDLSHNIETVSELANNDHKKDIQVVQEKNNANHENKNESSHNLIKISEKINTDHKNKIESNNDILKVSEKNDPIIIQAKKKMKESKKRTKTYQLIKQINEPMSNNVMFTYMKYA